MGGVCSDQGQSVPALTRCFLVWVMAADTWSVVVKSKMSPTLDDGGGRTGYSEGVGGQRYNM